MFITQRQELAIRLLYFFLPWPLSKLLPPNLGRLFFGPGGLPSSYFLDSLPFSIDTPGQDQTVPIYPPEPPVLIPAPSETTPVAVLSVPYPGLTQPPTAQLPVITPEPISSIPRYESIPAKVIPTSFTLPSSKIPVRPSAFVSSRGRGGSEAVSIFMPLPGTPGKVSEIPFKQSLPKISPQKSLFSSSRGRGGSVSTSIFMPLPGRKLAPATVAIKQPIPYLPGNAAKQTTLIKSISYKNTTPRMQRLLSMSNRRVSINPTQGLSMQQSSFVSGNSYTNLVRAFKPQASFPFGHTGGARGGSYSISFIANLISPGNSIFDNIYRNPSTGTAGGGAVTLDPASLCNIYSILSSGDLAFTCTAGSCGHCRPTTIHTTLKRYFEVTLSGTGAGFSRIGFSDSTWVPCNDINNAGHCNSVRFDGTGVNLSVPGAFTTGDTLMFAADYVLNTCFCGLNGAWPAGHDPTIGDPGFPFAGSAPFHASSRNQSSGSTHTYNFGATSFLHTVPSGFVPYNT